MDNLRKRKVAEHYIDNFSEFAFKQWNDFEYSLLYGSFGYKDWRNIKMPDIFLFNYSNRNLKEIKKI